MILSCFLVEETNKYMWSFGYKCQKKQIHVNLLEISSSNLALLLFTKKKKSTIAVLLVGLPVMNFNGLLAENI